MSFYCIKQNIPFSLYRADDISQKDTWKTVHDKAVSKSLICDFIEDPAAWKSSGKKVATKAMKAGSILDCLLTEPDQFHNRYIMSRYDKFQSNESKAWKQEMEDAGVEVLKQSEFDEAQAQVIAIKNKPEAAALMKGADFQVAFRHKTKHPFDNKGLIDILPPDKETIVDVKKCVSSALESKRALRKYIYDWSYHIGAGAYCDGFSVASGEERTRFKHIFVGDKPPYRVAVVELPIAAIMFGADIYRNGVNRFATCLETNHWPSIWDGEVELDLPEYAYNEGGAE
jgi:hypothetical protein